MKSQSEIYEALLNSRTLKHKLSKAIARLDDDGNVERLRQGESCWGVYRGGFTMPEHWEIYTPPRIPMTLECEVEWHCDNDGPYPFVTLKDSQENPITPFIGKRTKMTLTEILEEEK